MVHPLPWAGTNPNKSNPIFKPWKTFSLLQPEAGIISPLCLAWENFSLIADAIPGTKGEGFVSVFVLATAFVLLEKLFVTSQAGATAGSEFGLGWLQGIGVTPREVNAFSFNITLGHFYNSPSV